MIFFIFPKKRAAFSHYLRGVKKLTRQKFFFDPLLILYYCLFYCLHRLYKIT